MAAFLTTSCGRNPSICGQMNGQKRQTADQYAAFPRKEILTATTAGMNLEDILLSDVSLYKVPRAVRFRGRTQDGGHQGLGWEKGGYCSKWTPSVFQDGQVLEMGPGNGRRSSMFTIFKRYT